MMEMVHFFSHERIAIAKALGTGWLVQIVAGAWVLLLQFAGLESLSLMIFLLFLLPFRAIFPFYCTKARALVVRHGRCWNKEGEDVTDRVPHGFIFVMLCLVSMVLTMEVKQSLIDLLYGMGFPLAYTKTAGWIVFFWYAVPIPELTLSYCWVKNISPWALLHGAMLAMGLKLHSTVRKK
jgi:hypothetical protein